MLLRGQLGHENERTTSEHYFEFQPSTATKLYADQIAGGRGERLTRTYQDFGWGESQLAARVRRWPNVA